MRLPWPAALAGGLLLVVGAAGLVRAAVPLPSDDSAGGTGVAPIVVSDAYARAPAPPTDAMAAYFTVFNTTGRPDRLLSAVSGAGATSVLHDTVAGRMQVVAGGVVIPAHGKIVLSTGQGHVMIQKLFGTVRAGQTITLTLSFQHAGTIEVAAPVIGLGAPAPSGASTASPAPSPSGGAS